MKKLLLFIFAGGFAVGQVPAGYYDGTAGLTGYELKTKLHEILSRKHYSYSYGDILTFYPRTDADKYYENDNSVLDIYTEKPGAADTYVYNFNQNVGSVSAEGQGWNREHGMPQSTFYGVFPLYSDIHYVIPADAFINQRRSNYPYARNNGENLTFSNGSKLGKSTTPGYSNQVYEPIDEFKGDVARYLLYFAVRYEGILHQLNYDLSTMPLDGSRERAYEKWYVDLLLDWHNLDPVSQREIDRNNTVYDIQKVRNPFIDNPAWANAIWSVNGDGIAPSAPANIAVSKAGESFITVNWQPSNDADVLGYKVYINNVFLRSTNSTSFTIERLSPNTNYSISIKAYDKGFLESVASTVSAATTGVDALAKGLMITKYIEGSNSNRAIEITNKTGNDVDLSKYYLRIQFAGSNYYFGDPFQLEGTLAAGQSVVVINPFADFTQSGGTYTVDQARFVTNGPPLTFNGSNYVEISYGERVIKNISTQNAELAFTPVDAVGIPDTRNSLAERSLYRNATVSDPTIFFNLNEWTQYGTDFSEGLGTGTLSNDETKPVQAVLTIYPNPVRDELFVSGKEISKINKAQIFDLTGKLVLTVNQPFRVKNSLNVGVLKPGMYLLKLDEKLLKFLKN